MKQMNKTLLLSAILLTLCSYSIDAQNITGVWLSEKEEAKIEIFEENGLFFGKIVWVKEQTEKAKKSLGLLVLKDFVLEKKEGVYKGKIYEPRLDKIFDGTIKLKGDDELEVRGYVGKPIFGSSEIWKREKTVISSSVSTSGRLLSE